MFPAILVLLTTDKQRPINARINMTNNLENKLPPPAEAPRDPAMASLSDALRVSFKLLSFIMVLFVVLFLATGIEFIQPQEQGIVKVFGKVKKVVRRGLVYNWPYPIGEIQKVSTQERREQVDNFWLFETAEDKLKPLSHRRRSKEGLRPGWDGYLLTGDRNLIHIKFVCTYRVKNPLALTENIANLDEMMRMVLCEAAIYSASTRTADAIQIDHTGFLDQIKHVAQKQLDALMGIAKGQPHGVEITNVLLPQSDAKTWPLGAYDAYEQAQRAKSEKQTTINKAIAQAKQTLIEAVGATHYAQLVGESWENAAIQRAKTLAGGNYNLIGQLGLALDSNAQTYAANPKELAQIKKIIAHKDEIRQAIDRTLMSTTIGGQASQIIAQAESDKTRTIQSARRRARRFEELLGQYRKTPKLFLEKMWADAIDEALSRETNQKHYFLPGVDTYVLYLNIDPKISKQIRAYERKAK
jgi:regulator of protease activity HflC (stomatin/prohibitin superfamily)